MNNTKYECGMVTLYDDNYGTVLQATALYRILRSMKVTPTIIKYSRNYGETEQNDNTSILNKLQKMTPKQLLDYVVMYRSIREVKRKFSEFRKDNLTFTENSYHRYNIDTINDQYEAYVCGSDMIWSEEFVNDWEFFYLGFAPKKKSIAYAPSFGKNEIADCNIQKCLDYLHNIDYISCREEAGIELIKKDFCISAIQVVDPTILLTKTEWNELIKGEPPLFEAPYTLCYLFGGYDGNRRKLIKRLFELVDTQIKTIPMKRKEFNKYAIKTAVGPLDYLRLYRDTSFVITDTFHGMIFSLIFEKPFVVLKREDKGHWAKYADRMTSTLKMLGLEDRYIGSDDCVDKELLNLDYHKISHILNEKRLESKQYLSNSLRAVRNNEKY